jgi:hypothetical protein
VDVNTTALILLVRTSALAIQNSNYRLMASPVDVSNICLLYIGLIVMLRHFSMFLILFLDCPTCDDFESLLETVQILKKQVNQCKSLSFSLYSKIHFIS